MAQAMASMASLQGVLEGSLQLSGSNKLSSNNSRVTRFTVRAQQQQQQQQSSSSSEPQSSRRAVISLVATGLVSASFVQAVLAEAKPIKVGPPPPPSGGLRKSFIFSNHEIIVTYYSCNLNAKN